jgi:hypothetical protein
MDRIWCARLSSESVSEGVIAGYECGAVWDLKE